MAHEQRRLNVSPEVIVWARETADLNQQTAAGQIGVSVNVLTRWESGELKPTIVQVRKIAEVFNRPLGTLLMKSPIPNEDRPIVPDFRVGSGYSSFHSRNLSKAIARAYNQRGTLQEIAQVMELPEDVVWPNIRLDQNADPKESASILRSAVRLEEIQTRSSGRPEQFLRQLILSAESLGVAVTQVQSISIDEMRGFSLGDEKCALVVLNGADSQRGKTYSLLHELVHIGMRMNGLCNLSVGDAGPVERSCDEIAGQALMPEQLFLRRVSELDIGQWDLDSLSELSKPFGASSESALLRLIEVKQATWEDYYRLKPLLNEAYELHRQEGRDRTGGNDTPLFYSLKIRDLGHRYIRWVSKAYEQDVISSRDFASSLEVRFDKIPRVTSSSLNEPW